MDIHEILKFSGVNDIVGDDKSKNCHDDEERKVEDKTQDEIDISNCLLHTYDDADDEVGYKVIEADGQIRLFISGSEVHNDSIVGTYAEKKEAQNSVKEVLIQRGLLAHLQSTLGGSANKADAAQAVVRIANCLSWTYWRAHSPQHFPLNSGNAIVWFHTLIIQRYKLIGQFCTHLEQSRKLSASTVLNNLNALASGAKWLIFFSDLINAAPADGAAFQEVLKQHRRVYHKKKADSKGEFSIESAVAERTWPVGGIEELQTICKQRGAEFMSLHGSKMPHEIDQIIYREAHYLCFSHMYAFVAQGRKSGIADVKCHQYDDLMDIGHVLSEDFKTRTSHKYQAVLNSSQIQPWLHLLHLWRSRAVWNKREKEPQALAPDFFFLDWEGEPIGDKIGTYVTSFFRPHGLHITTTGLRSLVETTADQREKLGMITHAERLAVSSINTHSSKITQDYYVRSNISQDVQLARNAISPLHCVDNRRQQAPPEGSPDSLLSQDDSPVDYSTIDTQMIRSYQTYSPWVGPLVKADLRSHPSETIDVTPSVVVTEDLRQHQSGATVHTLPATSSPSAWSRRNVAPIPWGAAHPCYMKINVKTGKLVTRAEWSNDELDYIAKWYKEFQHENPDLGRTCSLFLSHIKKDKCAIPIFHEIHTLDSKRIRYGFDAARKLGMLGSLGFAANT